MKKVVLATFVSLSSLFSALAQNPAAEYIDVGVYSHYKYRPDGKAGREIYVSYTGPKEFADGSITVSSRLGSETTGFETERTDSISVLLPEGIGVCSKDTVVVCLQSKGVKLYEKVEIPPMRHWTVYIYPHSHVDIGYTNTQENVEFIHKRNLDVAMELAEKTASYPEDARFRWNPEVSWPVERYLNSADEASKQKLIDAIKKGYIHLDAGYISTNTSANSDEELLELFGFSKSMEKLTGKKVETMVQVDIPGVSWGVVPASNYLGIKYCLSLFNGYDRTGFSDELSFKPFWWIGPDGKSKVLFLQPGSYNPGALVKGKYFWPQLAGQTDQSRLLRVVKTDNPRENFIDSYLAEKLPVLENDKDYIYDIFPMTWCMADNTPIDADLPDAVKSWNEEYAYPHLKICSGTEMMDAFAAYGDRIPVLSGDYTEYWTDGLGTSAEHTAESWEVKERLVQSEILWSMLNGTEPAPEEITSEAWRHIILSTEHTWAFMQPDKQPISDDILNVKFGYFHKAAELTDKSMEKALASVIDDNSDILSVYNTNSWDQTSLVVLPQNVAEEYNAIFDQDGNEIDSQILTTGELVFVAENVPALGNRIYSLGKKKVPLAKLRKASESMLSTIGHGRYVIDNGIVNVTVDPLTGDVVSILYQGEEYVSQESMSSVNSYRYLKGDKPASYAFRPYNVVIEKKESGPVLNSLLITSDAEGVKKLSREIILVKGSENVICRNIVDKIATTEKEGIHFGFGFNVPDGKTMVNVPWGVMKMEDDQLAAGNRNWIAVQRWIDISNDDKGVVWCPLNAAVFESGDLSANILGGALHSPKWIRHLDESSTIYSWALNNHWHTNFRLSQDGRIEFKYILKPHKGGFDKAESNKFGLEQFRPLRAVRIKKECQELPNRLVIEGADNVYLSTYRTENCGSSAIVRFISMSDIDETISLKWNDAPLSANIVTGGIDGTSTPADLNAIHIPAKGSVTICVEWK